MGETEYFDLSEDFPDLRDLVKEFKGIALEMGEQSHEISEEKSTARLDERLSKIKLKRGTITKNSSVLSIKEVSNALNDSSGQKQTIGAKPRNKLSGTSTDNSQSQITSKGRLSAFPTPIFIKHNSRLDNKNGTENVKQKAREVSHKLTSKSEHVGWNIDSEISKQIFGLDALKISFSEDEYASETTPKTNIKGGKQTTQKTKAKIPYNKDHVETRNIVPKKISRVNTEIASNSDKLDKSEGGISDEKRFFSLSPNNTLHEQTNLSSPKKIPRIPLTPHRLSSDAFWQQDVINEWNDRFSPSKILFPRSKASSSNDKLENSKPLIRPVNILDKIEKKSREAKKLFFEKKITLANSFLHELDAKITGGEISKLAASSGGVKITWNKKLNSTAGRANWKCEKINSKNSLTDAGPNSAKVIHHATIELAEKVIDDEERLLNVMAHEFCHLATFMISNVKTNPHGREFKSWAAKCSKLFADRGVHVTTKHNYAIDYKYIWQCENCGIEVKRHSKSVNPARHRCGTCMSKLIQIKPVPRTNVKTSEYQTFVRKNMKILREENPGSPQKDIMTLVGKKYQEMKALRLEKGGSQNAKIENSNSVFNIGDDTKEKNIDLVAQNLNQLILD
ncbi:putative sprt family metallopeptidase [Erysiphe neolycopersici]|uniref:Putative sprt family metallopeptidase n=1 Tax=Erysiphe neolycopersici TaxID=212602 RepID=A0A420I8Q5_9PEZI|nr:putative sprt family metallopeptidase [Erysiphe neolycopersici]